MINFVISNLSGVYKLEGIIISLHLSLIGSNHTNRSYIMTITCQSFKLLSSHVSFTAVSLLVIHAIYISFLCVSVCVGLCRYVWACVHAYMCVLCVLVYVCVRMLVIVYSRHGGFVWRCNPSSGFQPPVCCRSDGCVRSRHQHNYICYRTGASHQQLVRD